MPSPEQNEIRIKKLEYLMETHPHKGGVSSKLEEEEVEKTYVQKALEGIDGLFYLPIRGLFDGLNSAADVIDSIRLQLITNAVSDIASTIVNIRWIGSTGTGVDQHGFVGTPAADTGIDAAGDAEMKLTFKQTINGTGTCDQAIVFGWGGEQIANSDTTYTDNHIAFFGYGASIDSTNLYISVGNGSNQYRKQITAFDLTEYATYKITVTDGVAEYFIDDVKVGQITSTETAYFPTTTTALKPILNSENEGVTGKWQSIYLNLNGYFVNTINN